MDDWQIKSNKTLMNANLICVRYGKVSSSFAVNAILSKKILDRGMTRMQIQQDGSDIYFNFNKSKGLELRKWEQSRPHSQSDSKVAVYSREWARRLFSELKLEYEKTHRIQVSEDLSNTKDCMIFKVIK